MQDTDLEGFSIPNRADRSYHDDGSRVSDQ